MMKETEGFRVVHPQTPPPFLGASLGALPYPTQPHPTMPYPALPYPIVPSKTPWEIISKHNPRLKGLRRTRIERRAIAVNVGRVWS